MRGCPGLDLAQELSELASSSLGVRTGCPAANSGSLGDPDAVHQRLDVTLVEHRDFGSAFDAAASYPLLAVFSPSPPHPI